LDLGFRFKAEEKEEKEIKRRNKKI